MGKQLLAVLTVLVMCLGPFAPALGTDEDGGSRAITPLDDDPTWYDGLDDTSHVYVPPGGLVGVEVTGGEAHLLPGHDEGWIASSVISCPDGFRYDLVLLEADVPGDSYVNVTILNATKASTNPGFANATVPGFINMTGTDASVFGVSRNLHPEIRIQVNLVASGADRPRLLSWSLLFIDLGEWRDDFLGTGKMTDHRGLNISSGVAELNMSRGGGTGFYDPFPSVLLANSENWLDVFYPTTDHTGYQNIVEITNVDGTYGVAVADLDGDGLLDVVCAVSEMAGYDDSLILWGSTSGKWSAADSTTVKTGADKVDTGDFNGDGEIDLIFINQGIGPLPDRGYGTLVFLNQGAGVFNDKPDVEYSNMYPMAMATGDVDADGYDDIVLWEGSIKASLYLGGSGGPSTTASVTYLDEYTGSASSGTRMVLLDDFDGDGFLDVSFNSKFNAGGNPSTVPFYLGSASGIDDTVDFVLDMENYPYAYGVGDLNYDGMPDLVVSTGGGTTTRYQLHVYKGTSNIWDKNNIHKLDTTYQVTHLVVVDVDKDGYDDVVTVDSDDLKVYEGGTAWPTTYSISKTGVYLPTDMALAVPKGASRGLAGTFVTEPIPLPTGKVWDVLHLDADVPDGTKVTITVMDLAMRPISGLEMVEGPDLDLSSIKDWRTLHVKVSIWSETNRSTPVLRRLLVNWMDEFTWRDQFYGTLKAGSVLGLGVVDDRLEGPADPLGTSDLVFASMRNQVGHRVDSTGFVDAGGLDYTSIPPVAFKTVGATAVDADDVNGDGIEDLVFASYGKNPGDHAGTSPLFLGSPAGWYGAPHHTFATAGAMDVVITDLDDDGHPDVVFAQEQDWMGVGVKSWLFLGSDDGWKAKPDVEFATSGASGVEAVDVDGDGLLDLVFACYEDTDKATDSMVFLQDSAGFCGTAPDYRLPTVGARSVASGDLDDDGRVDLVFACYDDGVTFEMDSLVYWGQAGGGFASVPGVLPTVGAMDVEVADLDADGDLDIVFANNRNATAGYLSEAYVYLGDGSRGLGTSPSVRLPTEGASAVEVADLDGTGHLDLVFACLNNGTGFRIPSVVYLGGASGWGGSPDILLPTVGAMDSMATLLSDPDRGGYVSNAITPDEEDDIGTFHILRYDASLGASQSATLAIIDDETGETVWETSVVSGSQEIDLRGTFSYQAHPSIRILVTVEGLEGGGTFAIDDLWINWTKRVPMPPEVREAQLTNTTCYRTKTVQILVDVWDEFDPPGTLKVLVQHRLVGATEWATNMRGTPVFQDGVWRVDITPDRYAALGTYLFRVTAEDSDRMVSPELVLEDTLEVLPNLPGPPSLEATPGDSQVELTWRAPTSLGDLPVEGYWLLRGTSEDALGKIVKLDSFATSYTDDGLVNGRTYHYAIHAFNELGDGVLSAVVNATPAGLPGAPVGLVAEAGDGRVTLTWEVPSVDGGKPVLVYYVYRSTGDGDLEWLTDVYDLVYEDAGLTNGEAYTYRVSALNALGEGASTEAVIVVPLGVPDAPGEFVVTAGLKSLSLAWVAPAGTGGGSITGYRIYKGDDPDDLEFVGEVRDHILQYVDSSVTVGNTYYYAVSTVTGGGESARSPAVPGVPVDLPGTPAGLVATPGDGEVVLTWSSPGFTGGTAITGYVILRGFSASSLSEVTTIGDVTTFTDTSVTNERTYWYAVRAINVMGRSDPTDAVEVTPFTPPTAPGKVLSLAAEAKGGKVVLGWVSPSEDGGSPVTGFAVLRGESTEGMVEIAQVGLLSSYTDDGVERGKTYYYSVAALNAVGQGERIQPVMVTVPKETEAGLPVVPIALALVALVVIVLLAVLLTRRRAAPAGVDEEVAEEEAAEAPDEEAGEEGAEGDEEALETEGAEDGEAPEAGEDEGTEEDPRAHPEIVIEYREVR